MTPQEIAKVQAYMRKRFANPRIQLVRRPQKDDSVEVVLDDEFLGVIFRDDEDGEVCYQLNMTILDIDLDSF